MNFRRLVYGGLVAPLLGLAVLACNNGNASQDAQLSESSQYQITRNYRCNNGNVMDIYAEVTNRDAGSIEIRAITEEPVSEPVVFNLDGAKPPGAHNPLGYELAAIDGSGEIVESTDLPVSFFAPDLKAHDTSVVRVAMPYVDGMEEISLVHNGEQIATANLRSFCEAVYK